MQRSYTIHYHQCLFSLHLNPGPGLASVGKNMDSVNAVETHHEHMWKEDWWQMMLGQPVLKASQEITGTSKVFTWGKHGCMPCHVHGVHTPALPAPTFAIRPQQQQKMVSFLWCCCFVSFCFVSAGLLRVPISYFCLPFHDSVPNS